MNRDQLHTTNAFKAGGMAFKVIDAVQDAPPAVRLQTVALVFRMMCTTLKIKPTEVLEVVDRIIHDAEHETYSVEFGALQMYLENELK